MRVGMFAHTPGRGDVLIKRQVRSINHDRAVMTGCDRFGATFFVAVVVMNREGNGWINSFCAAQQIFEHQRLGIVPHDARKLDDDGRVGTGGAAKKAMDLFEVADVESADSLAAKGGFK